MLGTATKFDIAMPNTSANFMRCTFSCGNKQEMSSIYVNVNGKYVTDWTVGGSFSMVVEFMKIGASSYVMSMNVHCAMRNSDMSYRLTTSTNKLDYASIQKITFEHSQAGYKLENCAYTLEWSQWEDYMKYILVNTLRNNTIEKIIPKEAGVTFIPSSYPSYLKMIEDINDEIKSLNYRYDEETKSFIELSEQDIKEMSYETLVEENLQLKLAMAELSEEKDQEILDLELALAEIVEGGLI